METHPDCIFCRIIKEDVPSYKVFEDEHSVAFLDTRPLFPGHVLLVPRAHRETLMDLPDDLIRPFFEAARTLAGAVETGMKADGVFVAANNRVSQSVPHLHFHIVPRRRKDGMRGFFWPRTRYTDEKAAFDAADAIRAALSTDK